MERKSYIQIASGDVFDPMDPDPDKILLGDIATALSNQCRFTGHVQRFYSVAEHSVHVSRCVPPQHSKAALLHDASEAYIGDLNSPMKNETELGRLYREVEAPLQAMILHKFGVETMEWEDSVKTADEFMREIERLQLLPRTAAGDELWAEWPADSSLVPQHCWPQCWAPEMAKVLFMERCKEVGL